MRRLLLAFAVASSAIVLTPRDARAADDDKSDSAKEKDKEKDKDKDSKWGFTGELDALYLRGNSMVVRGSNADASGLGFNVGTTGWFSAALSIFDFHFDYNWFIGGGANGLDGQLENHFLGGVYIPVTHDFGPFLRVGAGGQYRDNDSYVSSHLDLPMGQLGVRATGNGYGFEAAGEGAITVGGRFITGDGSRRVLDGLPTLGGFGQIHLWPVLVRVQYRGYVQDRDAPAPEEWTTRACGAFPFIKDGFVGPIDVCFDGSWMHGGVFQPGQQTANDSHVYYTGISIGIGGLMSSAAKPSSDRPSDDKGNEKNNDAARAAEPRPDNSQPVVASSGALDAEDMRRLTREAMSHFSGSRTMQEWLGTQPRPVAAVLPFGNQLPNPIAEDVLVVARKETEGWLLSSQAAEVVDRGATDRAATASGGATEANAQAIGRALNARYVVFGWVEPGAKVSERDRTTYSLVVRVLDVQTNAIVWQHGAEITKMHPTR